VATKIRTGQIMGSKLQAVESTLVQEGRTEAYDLEAWIASDPTIIGPDLIVIGRQVTTKSGPLAVCRRSHLPASETRFLGHL